MNQYKIFKHPNNALEAIKQGWSWPAFCFGGCWAIAKKLWKVLGMLIGASLLFVLLLSLILPTLSHVQIALVIFSPFFAAAFGQKGNAWREQNVLSRGYEHVDTISASNPEGAAALYLKSSTSV